MDSPAGRTTRAGAILFLAGLRCFPAWARSNTAAPQPLPCRPGSAAFMRLLNAAASCRGETIERGSSRYVASQGMAPQVAPPLGGEDPPVYVKLQLESGKVIGRSFHYSERSWANGEE